MQDSLNNLDMNPENVEENVNAFVKFVQGRIPDAIELGVRIVIALIIILIGRYLIKVIRNRTRKRFERIGTDQGVSQFTDSILKFSLYIILILMVAANFGINLSSLSVIFASAGVGITLALQESLSNFAGGLFILILRPFVVGDYIIEDTNKNEGTVKEIRIFHTKLTTIDNKTILIPNGTLINNSITNVTDKLERQLDLRVGISYQSDLRKAKEILQRLLDEQSAILDDKQKNIFVDSLGDSAVILGVRAWVKTDEYWATRWELLENIKLTFDEEGIDIPFNQLTVHFNKENDAASTN